MRHPEQIGHCLAVEDQVERLVPVSVFKLTHRHSVHVIGDLFLAPVQPVNMVIVCQTPGCGMDWNMIAAGGLSRVGEGERSHCCFATLGLMTKLVQTTRVSLQWTPMTRQSRSPDEHSFVLDPAKGSSPETRVPKG